MAKSTTTPSSKAKLTAVPPAAPEATRQAAPETNQVSEEERERLICERAYQIAEARGFHPGAELDDWLAAEREIEQKHPRS